MKLLKTTKKKERIKLNRCICDMISIMIVTKTIFYVSKNQKKKIVKKKSKEIKKNNKIRKQNFKNYKTKKIKE